MEYTEQDVRTALERARGEDDGETELPAAEPPNPARVTALGTRCAEAWDDDWIAAVEAREAELDRRICGARTPAGTPCRFGSTHESGRCRFHGGFDLTGAPEGNRNAVIHGLYSRRLTMCGKHCPAWASCPLGGGKARVEREQAAAERKALVSTPEGRKQFADENVPMHRELQYGKPVLDVLSVPLDERPTCPYEQSEYNAAVTDATQSAWRRQHADPYSKHVAHTLALVQVMVSRAALALRHQGFTETMKVTGKNYTMETSKPSAAFTAFLKLQREYRQMVALTRPREIYEPHRADRLAYELRCDTDTRVDADAPPPTSPATLHMLWRVANEFEEKERADEFAADFKEAAADLAEHLKAMGWKGSNYGSSEYAWLDKDPFDDEEKGGKEKPTPKQRE